ncbi:MAG: hypothetical protein IAF02_16725 [Anaerolineae bacterium]|nr:hypothetical protein [Anaerolineae bacterium]
MEPVYHTLFAILQLGTKTAVIPKFMRETAVLVVTVFSRGLLWSGEVGVYGKMQVIMKQT